MSKTKNISNNADSNNNIKIKKNMGLSLIDFQLDIIDNGIINVVNKTK